MVQEAVKAWTMISRRGLSFEILSKDRVGPKLYEKISDYEREVNEALLATRRVRITCF